MKQYEGRSNPEARLEREMTVHEIQDITESQHSMKDLRAAIERTKMTIPSSTGGRYSTADLLQRLDYISKTEDPNPNVLPSAGGFRETVLSLLAFERRVKEANRGRK